MFEFCSLTERNFLSKANEIFSFTLALTSPLFRIYIAVCPHT